MANNRLNLKEIWDVELVENENYREWPEREEWLIKIGGVRRCGGEICQNVYIGYSDFCYIMEQISRTIGKKLEEAQRLKAKLPCIGGC